MIRWPTVSQVGFPIVVEPTIEPILAAPGSELVVQGAS